VFIERSGVSEFYERPLEIHVSFSGKLEFNSTLAQSSELLSKIEIGKVHLGGIPARVDLKHRVALEVVSWHSPETVRRNGFDGHADQRVAATPCPRSGHCFWS
jgi:hypothetical protein